MGLQRFAQNRVGNHRVDIVFVRCQLGRCLDEFVLKTRGLGNSLCAVFVGPAKQAQYSESVSLGHLGHFLGGESGVAPYQRTNPIVVVILRII